jgi:hypothetical protein
MRIESYRRKYWRDSNCIIATIVTAYRSSHCLVNPANNPNHFEKVPSASERFFLHRQKRQITIGMSASSLPKTVDVMGCERQGIIASVTIDPEMRRVMRFFIRSTRQASTRAFRAVYYPRIVVRDYFSRMVTHLKRELASIPCALVADSISKRIVGCFAALKQFRSIALESNSP